jgi:hypothetical protein
MAEHTIPRRSDDELRAFVDDFVSGRLFSDRPRKHITLPEAPP